MGGVNTLKNLAQHLYKEDKWEVACLYTVFFLSVILCFLTYIFLEMFRHAGLSGCIELNLSTMSAMHADKDAMYRNYGWFNSPIPRLINEVRNALAFALLLISLRGLLFFFLPLRSKNAARILRFAYGLVAVAAFIYAYYISGNLFCLSL